MTAVKIQSKGELFCERREAGSLYVDKTPFLEDFLTDPADVTLLTRPRRFGKTLLMTMLWDFFDITRDSRKHFEGLAVSHKAELCQKWMNQYPVIFLTLKGIEGETFEQALWSMEDTIQDLISRHKYLLKSKRVAPCDRDKLKALATTDNIKLLRNSLNIISKSLYDHWGKKPVILIDEYDVPVACAERNGYYEKMTEFFRYFLGTVLKTGLNLQFAILTGCLRLVHESIFTGLNNFTCCGISDHRYSSAFGFTHEETVNLLEQTGFSEKMPQIREWYDGYRFGQKVEIYCPWDIMQYLSALQGNSSMEPQCYWQNTSHNNILKNCLARMNTQDLRDKIEILVNGGCIQSVITDAMTYNNVYNSEENFWSLMYFTGYLTIKYDETATAYDGFLNGKSIPLVIPNREIQLLFTTTIRSWFTDTFRTTDRKELFQHLWNGDANTLSEMITDELYATVSYYDVAHENYYHAFLTGLFSFSSWSVESNAESGNGRPDICIKDLLGKRAIILEIKIAPSEASLNNAAQKGLAQIKEKKYDAGLPSRIKTIIHYGAAFCKKECRIVTENRETADA